MKLLILSDIHHGFLKASTTHPGIYRQSNELALQSLRELRDSLDLSQFDLLVQMGDLIKETGDSQKDSQLLEEVLEDLQTFNLPTIHLLGNHDSVTDQHLSYVQTLQRYFQSSTQFGLREVGDATLLWLDFQNDSNGLAELSTERLEWLLQETDRIQNKLIVFSHYSLIPHDTANNFLFEGKPEKTHYTNHAQIRQVLDRLEEGYTSIHAHLHCCSYSERGKSRFVTVPSFSDNITSLDTRGVHPQIYTTLELTGDTFSIRSYSQGFVFWQMEIGP